MPAREQPTKKPVGIDRTSSAFTPDVKASIRGVQRRYVKSKLPGEVSGDAVVFEVEVTNDSSDVVDLTNLVVNTFDAGGDPAGRISTAPATRMPGAVGAGKKVRARYVAVVPKKSQDEVRIEVSLSADYPVLVFSGSTSS